MFIRSGAFEEEARDANVFLGFLAHILGVKIVPAYI